MASKLVSGGKPFGCAIVDGSLSDRALVESLGAYRRRVAGNYRPLPPEEIDQLPPGQMWVSHKIDGELWYLVSLQNEIFLANPRGQVIAGDIPVLREAAALPDGTVIAGELHARVKDRRCRVGDLSTLLAGGKKARAEELVFAAFDLVQEAGAAISVSYEDRQKRLNEILSGGKKELASFVWTGFPLR